MNRFHILLVLAFFLARPRPGAALQLLPVVTKGLSHPVDIVTAPGEPDRLYIVEQAGRILVAEKGTLLPAPFLDIRTKVGPSSGELGLLSLAFHPNYNLNHRYFVNYTSMRPGRVTVVAEYVAGKTEEKEILKFTQPFANHNGGQLAFDTKGLLYIATGDGGSGGDPQGNGQSLKTLLGKILCIDIDHGTPYAIPPTNPFVKGGGEKEIFAYGLRNPWRFSFDRKTGALFAADVGQWKWEEIDIILRGKNYGWNVREGKHCFEGDKCQTLGLEDPIYEYGRTDGFSITGGFVYRGKQLPALVGAYIYGDYGSGRIWALHYDQEKKKVIRNELLLDTSHQISSFGQDANGELYLASHRGGIYRLAP